MTPALQAVESRVLLTKTEREVALLAAAGHSNKEIAESLFLSRKTVENYLRETRRLWPSRARRRNRSLKRQGQAVRGV